jgi:hypothetical protein
VDRNGIAFVPMMPALARTMLEAYGGAGRWSAAQAVEARLSLHGLLFRWKRRTQGSWPDLRVRAEIGHPRTRLEPFDREGNVGVLEGHTVRIERPGGEVLESRANAREGFPYGRRLFAWDRLDITYFVGYAMWNYLTLPSLLLREDVAWSELPGSTLEARYPSHLPTHCAREQFLLDPQTSLLRQHDYTADVFGGWAKAAHLVTAHGRSGDLVYPSKRRVKPHNPAGRGALPGPLLIWIDIHEYALV